MPLPLPSAEWAIGPMIFANLRADRPCCPGGSTGHSAFRSQPDSLPPCVLAPAPPGPLLGAGHFHTSTHLPFPLSGTPAVPSVPAQYCFRPSPGITPALPPQHLGNAAGYLITIVISAPNCGGFNSYPTCTCQCWRLTWMLAATTGSGVQSRFCRKRKQAHHS